MVAPKGEPKTSQAYVYKGSESKLVGSAEAEEMLANGWFDNPKCEKSELQIALEKNAALEAAAAKKPAAKKAAAKKPADEK